MILYFTGTGNSRWAAAVIQSITGDEMLSMNSLIRRIKTEPEEAQTVFHSESPWVFVCPTWCWQLPRVVEDFIRSCSFTGSKKAYFFLTCGGSTGGAEKHAARLCNDKGFEFMGLGSAVMPDNYIVLYDTPDYDEALAKLRSARSTVESAARYIATGRELKDYNIGSFKMPAFGNRLFYKFMVKDKKFRVKKSCSGCGLCESLCPLGNIKLTESRPKWQGNCTHCMACINACPEKAIEYGSATAKRGRYYLRADGSIKT